MPHLLQVWLGNHYEATAYARGHLVGDRLSYFSDLHIREIRGFQAFGLAEAWEGKGERQGNGHSSEKEPKEPEQLERKG